MIPLCEARDEDPFEVGHDGVERFGIFRGMVGQGTRDVARCDARKHRIRFKTLEVVGNPVHERMPVPAKLVLFHQPPSPFPASRIAPA